MNQAEINLIERLREVGEQIQYGSVKIDITYSRGQLKKVLITNKEKMVLLD